MKLHLTIDGLEVNFEADVTSGNEVAALAKLRELLFSLAGFENVRLSVNTFSNAPAEVISAQAAWPFPNGVYDDMTVVADEDVPAEEPAAEPEQPST